MIRHGRLCKRCWICCWQTTTTSTMPVLRYGQTLFQSYRWLRLIYKVNETFESGNYDRSAPWGYGIDWVMSKRGSWRWRRLRSNDRNIHDVRLFRLARAYLGRETGSRSATTYFNLILMTRFEGGKPLFLRRGLSVWSATILKPLPTLYTYRTKSLFE